MKAAAKKAYYDNAKLIGILILLGVAVYLSLYAFSFVFAGTVRN